MPIYEYECEGCHRVHEVMQKFSDAPLAECPDCGKSVHKIMSRTSFALKGTGWYSTDYKKSAVPPAASGPSIPPAAGTTSAPGAGASPSTSAGANSSAPASESAKSAAPLTSTAPASTSGGTQSG